MNQKTVTAVDTQQATSQEKQPYHTPTLQVFGSVNTLTQGTGSVNGDGGQGMMAAMA